MKNFLLEEFIDSSNKTFCLNGFDYENFKRINGSIGGLFIKIKNVKDEINDFRFETFD